MEKYILKALEKFDSVRILYVKENYDSTDREFIGADLVILVSKDKDDAIIKNRFGGKNVN